MIKGNKMLLITGCNGQLGSELKKFYFDKEAVFTDLPEFDITNIDSIKKFFNNTISGIINCAAYTAVDKAEEEKKLCFKINADGVKNLAEISADYKIPLIHISTDYVFDGTNYMPYKETDTLNPQSVYGRSKAEGDKIFINSAYSGIIIRTSWLYSEFCKNFVKTIIKLGNERNEINVISDQIGTPTYAYDLAEVIKKIIAQIKPEQKGIYNFSNEGAASWYDFAYEIIKQKGIKCNINPIETKYYPTPAKRPHYSLLNKDKIKNTFNIKIRHWKEALKQCLTKIS